MSNSTFVSYQLLQIFMKIGKIVYVRKDAKDFEYIVVCGKNFQLMQFYVFRMS